MSEPRPASLYICNWSLAEPLCESQTLPYLRALAARGYRSCLMTFERPPYALDAGAGASRRRVLAGEGVCWHPVTYHSPRSLLSALFDVVQAVFIGVIALARHRARLLHTRTSVPAPLGLLLARLSGRRFLYDADSELSEEYADGGHWRRDSLTFRTLSWLEDVCRRHADAMIVLTERLERAFSGRGVRAPITVIPCCVDIDRFRFSAREREARRAMLGLGAGPLLIYAGKIGPRYLVSEMMAFTRALANRAEGVRLLVLTHEPPEAFEALAATHGLEPGCMTVRRADHDEVPAWLSAADAGLAFIRPAPSERGSSPIKMSEYLAGGLPVVVTSGIGDISEIVAARSLGVVVSDHSASAHAAASDRLLELWRDREGLRERCASWARATLDVRIAATRYAEVYERLLA